MTIQTTAALISGLGILVMIGVYLFVVARTHAAAPYEAVQPRAYGVRKKLFFALLVGFVLVTGLTLRDLPYSAHASADATVVEVTAHQWYWSMSRTEVPRGRPVLFRVGSEDVNHGFAIYDPAQRLIAQVQAMPGYVNELAVRFDHPGTYRIMCLEYCGLVHHGMIGVIRVPDTVEEL